MTTKQRLNLKDYRVLKELKGNSSNQIFLVRDRSGKRVIFKRIKIHNFPAQLREIQAQKNLHHRYIVRLLDYEIQNEFIVLIIELAQDGDLFDFINNIESIRESKLLRLFYKIVIGVHFIHLNGFIHRDIKPENILMSEGEPKLADFGSSVAESVVRNTFCGTYEYMAPEIYLRKPQTAKVDVWALGVLLFEMTHNRTPFKGRDVSEIKKIVNRKRLDFDEQISSKIRRIIYSLLQFKPQDRPTTAQVLKLPELKRFYEEMKPELLAIYQDKSILKLRKIRSCNRGFGEERGYRHMKTANEIPNIKQMKIIKDDDNIGISNVPMSFQKLEDCEFGVASQNPYGNPNQFKKVKKKVSIEATQDLNSHEDKKNPKKLEKAASQQVRDLLKLQQEISQKGVKEVLKNTKKVSYEKIKKQKTKPKIQKSFTSQILQKIGLDSRQIQKGFERIMGRDSNSRQNSKHSKNSKKKSSSNKNRTSNNSSKTNKSLRKMKTLMSQAPNIKPRSRPKNWKPSSLLETNQKLQSANWGLHSKKQIFHHQASNLPKPKFGVKMNSLVCMKMKYQKQKTLSNESHGSDSNNDFRKNYRVNNSNSRPYLGIGSMKSIFETQSKKNKIFHTRKMRQNQSKIKEKLKLMRKAKSKVANSIRSIDKTHGNNLALQFGPKKSKHTDNLKNISNKLIKNLNSSKNSKNQDSPKIHFNPGEKNPKLASTEDSSLGKTGSEKKKIRIQMQMSDRQIRGDFQFSQREKISSNKMITKWEESLSRNGQGISSKAEEIIFGAK